MITREEGSWTEGLKGESGVLNLICQSPAKLTFTAFFREQDELFRPAHHDGHIAHVFKIASILNDNANNGTHKENLTDLMNGEFLR